MVPTTIKGAILNMADVEKARRPLYCNKGRLGVESQFLSFVAMMEHRLTIVVRYCMGFTAVAPDPGHGVSALIFTRKRALNE